METRARYATVGFAALALIAAMVIFGLWLNQVQFDQEYAEYQISFKGPVRGLTEASEVRFNGIKVGDVTRLGLDPVDPSRVIAQIRVVAQTPFKTDSVAQLEPQGLTGLSYVQVSSGSPNASALSRGERLSSRQAQLDTLFDAGEDVAGSTIEALNRVQALLSVENVENVSRIIANLETASARVVSDDGAMDRFFATLAAVERASADVSSLSTETERMFNQEIAAMVRETELASIEVNRASEEAIAIMTEARGPLTRFANQGLDEATLAITELRRLMETLEAIAVELEDDPAAFIAGNSPREVELPR